MPGDAATLPRLRRAPHFLACSSGCFWLNGLNCCLAEFGCRSEGFPERDIWSLGVMAQGLDQMGEFLGRRRRRRRRRRRHLEIQVDIQARKLYFEGFLWFWTPGERSRRMETGVLLRISLRVS